MEAMTQRFLSSPALVPVLLDHELGPTELGSLSYLQTVDFSEFAFLGEGFSRSERYVAFQQAVRKLANGLAMGIQA